MWDSLNKRDHDNLNSYRRSYRWYKETEDQISELQDQLKSLKDKKESYVKKLTRLNYDLDHLRNDFYFSFSITYRPKKNYYNCDISRRRYNKSGGLGSERLILKHLQKYYENDKSKLDEMERIGWERFIRKEVMNPDGEIYGRIVKSIMKDVRLNGMTLNRHFLFPLDK